MTESEELFPNNADGTAMTANHDIIETWKVSETHTSTDYKKE